MRTLFCGDGGNRTRVRKIRPSGIYERSLSNLSPGQSTTDRELSRLAAGTRKPLFHAFSSVAHGTLTLLRLLCHRSEGGAGRRGPSQGPGCRLTRLCSEGQSSIGSAVIGT